MPWFLTEYRENWAPISGAEPLCRPGNYSAHLWATTRRQATRIALRRGIGERIVFCSGTRQPYRFASQVLAATRGRNTGMYPKLHSLNFLCMIALSSGTATLQETIGDRGILHDMCHARAITKDLIERVKVIERRTPGYLPKPMRLSHA